MSVINDKRTVSFSSSKMLSDTDNIRRYFDVVGRRAYCVPCLKSTVIVQWSVKLVALMSHRSLYNVS